MPQAGNAQSSNRHRAASTRTIPSRKTKDLAKRTTEEVFLDHLELRKHGRLEEDITRNYDERVLIVSNFGTFFGHDGVLHSANLLRKLLPTLKYKYDSLLIHQQIAFEEWEAKARGKSVRNGIDAFVISKGKIRVQTIWYDPEPRRTQRAASRGFHG
jgi:hypothetical protein